MKRFYTKAERESYRKGKIRGYYIAKRRASKKQEKKTIKYGNYDPNEAFRRTLQRTYESPDEDD